MFVHWSFGIFFHETAAHFAPPRHGGGVFLGGSTDRHDWQVSEPVAASSGDAKHRQHFDQNGGLNLLDDDKLYYKKWGNSLTNLSEMVVGVPGLLDLARMCRWKLGNGDPFGVPPKISVGNFTSDFPPQKKPLPKICFKKFHGVLDVFSVWVVEMVCSSKGDIYEVFHN